MRGGSAVHQLYCLIYELMIMMMMEDNITRGNFGKSPEVVNLAARCLGVNKQSCGWYSFVFTAIRCRRLVLRRLIMCSCRERACDYYCVMIGKLRKISSASTSKYRLVCSKDRRTEITAVAENISDFHDFVIICFSSWSCQQCCPLKLITYKSGAHLGSCFFLHTSVFPVSSTGSLHIEVVLNRSSAYAFSRSDDEHC